jgi:phosphoenolpyruvate synthase/pyruvate phosphate dikinase
VRSSARAEDGADHSHAGQFDTFLNVAAKDVWDGRKKVWRSGFSDTVATYRAVKTGGAAEGPAVIVQRMIDATAAGVAFSADPVSGQRGKVVISAIAGLGEALVSGEGRRRKLAGRHRASALRARGSDTLDQAMEIADLARRAEAAFGAPQDIEWAFDGDGLHILQSRPITTPLLPAPNPDDRADDLRQFQHRRKLPRHGQPPDLFLRGPCLHARLPGLRRPAGCAAKTIEATPPSSATCWAGSTGGSTTTS